MEAAASGVPVIATDIRGCRQAVDHGITGLLVPLGDVNALVVAIADLAVAPSIRLAMSSEARRKAEADFDDQAVIRKTLDAYRRLPTATA
jgi:glycosyltransferase involved in cell wall biosynthesis